MASWLAGQGPTPVGRALEGRMAEMSLDVWRSSIPGDAEFIDGALLDFLEKRSEFAAHS